MSFALKIGHKVVDIRDNWVDRLVCYFDPIRGQERFKARVSMGLGGYAGASRSRRALSEFNPFATDADSAASTYELDILRARSRSLVRDAPVAGGAIETVCTNAVGVGLRVHAQVDRVVLGLDEGEADALEAQIDREWRLFSETQECDSARTLTFTAMQDLVFRSALESGDVFVLMRAIKRPGSPYNLKLQVIEADRVSNESNQRDTAKLVGGVEKDDNGAPVAYHIMDQHPGNLLTGIARSWKKVPAFGSESGRRNVIHLYQVLRPGQTRGVPYLAPVIEALKQLDRYTEAELMAAVISGMFTVFIKSDSGEGSMAPMEPTAETGGKTNDEDYRLGNGAIVSLGNKESIETANPGRPNTAFDPFVMAILRQIGSRLEIPFELLVKHFTSSYSAARAALLEAWKFFNKRRTWLADNFCRIVYEAWMEEAVLSGRIYAPGFFDDPLVKKAYLGSTWIGPAKGMINEVDEATAAQLRMEMGITTLEEETASMTGGDFEKNHIQSAKEFRMRKEAGLVQASAPPVQRVQTVNQTN